MMKRGSGKYSAIQTELLSAGIRCLVRTDKLSTHEVAKAIAVDTKAVNGWVQHGSLPDTEDVCTRLYEYVIKQCQSHNDLRFFVTLMGSNDDGWRVPQLILEICTTVFGIDSTEFRSHSELLVGEYLCQRYSSEKDIITEWLKIIPFDESGGISRFENSFNTRYGSYDANGYLIPAQNALFFCGIVHAGRKKPYPRFMVAREILNMRLPEFTAIVLDTDHDAFPMASKMLCKRQEKPMTAEEKSRIITYRTMASLDTGERENLTRSIGDSPIVFE